MKLKLYIYLLLFIVSVSACSEMFEYSTYDTPVKSHEYNIKNIKKILDSYEVSDTLKFVLISDTHGYYDDFADAVKNINKLPEAEKIRFVICSGDLTDAGLAKEFKWYWDIAKKIKYPVISVIGNHDYRSNGLFVFNHYFGDPNFSFVYGNYRFVFFDDVVWENHNTSPRFDWLQNQLTLDSLHNILVAHIPPWTDQLQGDKNVVFNQIVTRENTAFSMYGHNHSFEEQDYNGVHSIVSGSVSKRWYNIITLVGEKASVKRIKF